MRNRGVGIPEFAVCLIAILLAFIPICNAVFFAASCFTIQTATSEVANLVSMAESRDEAKESAATIHERLKSPIWTSLHAVRPIDSGIVQGNKNIATVQLMEAKSTRTLSIERPLPDKFKPEFENNKDRYRYSYSIDVPCEIRPFFNVSGFPIIGQLPAIGAPVRYRFHAESAVEYLDALNQ